MTRILKDVLAHSLHEKQAPWRLLLVFQNWLCGVATSVPTNFP